MCIIIHRKSNTRNSPCTCTWFLINIVSNISWRPVAIKPKYNPIFKVICSPNIEFTSRDVLHNSKWICLRKGDIKIYCIKHICTIYIKFASYITIHIMSLFEVPKNLHRRICNTWILLTCVTSCLLFLINFWRFSLIWSNFSSMYLNINKVKYKYNDALDMHIDF